jgi:hypothetical protein
MLHQQSFGWNLVQNTASYQHEEALLPPTQVGQGSATVDRNFDAAVLVSYTSDEAVLTAAGLSTIGLA